MAQGKLTLEQLKTEVAAGNIDTVVAACKKHRKALGRLVPNVETGIAYNKWGFDFICYSGDVWVLHNAVAAAIAELREKCKRN